jgi:hypothetical protein
MEQRQAAQVVAIVLIQIEGVEHHCMTMAARAAMNSCRWTVGPVAAGGGSRPSSPASRRWRRPRRWRGRGIVSWRTEKRPQHCREVDRGSLARRLKGWCLGGRSPPGEVEHHRRPEVSCDPIRFDIVNRVNNVFPTFMLSRSRGLAGLDSHEPHACRGGRALGRPGMHHGDLCMAHRPSGWHDLTSTPPPLWRVDGLDILRWIVRPQSIKTQPSCLAAYRPARAMQQFDKFRHRMRRPQGD